MSASSKRPWMVPSSPKVPWRTGKMTSSDWAREPFCCARASWRSATPALARSATDLVVVRFFWIGAGFVLPASRCWASAEVSHWPCLVIPMGITSYFVWSMDLRMEAAERRETSCSPERPPKRMPTRSFFFGRFFVMCDSSLDYFLKAGRRKKFEVARWYFFGGFGDFRVFRDGYLWRDCGD